MKKILLIIVLLLFAASATACGTKVTYPYLEYRNSSYNFDILNKTILLEDGFSLNDGNPYDIIDRDDGYDLVIHFVKK